MTDENATSNLQGLDLNTDEIAALLRKKKALLHSQISDSLHNKDAFKGSIRPDSKPQGS